MKPSTDVRAAWSAEEQTSFKAVRRGHVHNGIPYGRLERPHRQRTTSAAVLRPRPQRQPQLTLPPRNLVHSDIPLIRPRYSRRRIPIPLLSADEVLSTKATSPWPSRDLVRGGGLCSRFPLLHAASSATTSHTAVHVDLSAEAMTPADVLWPRLQCHPTLSLPATTRPGRHIPRPSARPCLRRRRLLGRPVASSTVAAICFPPPWQPRPRRNPPQPSKQTCPQRR